MFWLVPVEVGPQLTVSVLTSADLEMKVHFKKIIIIKQTCSDTELLYGSKINVYSSQLEKPSSLLPFFFGYTLTWNKCSSSMLHKCEALWPCVTSWKCLCQWDVTSGTPPPNAVQEIWEALTSSDSQGGWVVCLWRVVTTHQKLMCCCTAGCLRSVTVATVKSVDLQTQRQSFNLLVTLTRVLTLLIQINHIFYSVY